MRALSWDMELEQWAANWAARCPNGHRSNTNKVDKSYFGENIYWTTGGFTPAAAVDAWYSEVKDFPDTYNTPFQWISTPMIGHYTQVTWAGTTTVGCGVALCSNWYNVVCNYGPGGNMMGGSQYAKGAVNCATLGVNTQYPSKQPSFYSIDLCGEVNASSVATTSVDTCPPEPTAGTAPTTTTPTTPVVTTPTTTTTTAPAVVTTTTGLEIGADKVNAWYAANPNHPGWIEASTTAVNTLAQYYGGTWTITKTNAIYTTNGGEDVQFVFTMSNGTSQKQFIINTSDWYFIKHTLYIGTENGIGSLGNCNAPSSPINKSQTRLQQEPFDNDMIKIK